MNKKYTAINIEDLEKHPTFCPHPFLQAAVMSMGQIQTCCTSTRSRNSSQNEKGNIKAYWNSEYLKEVRSDLLNSKKHKDCSICWKQEADGIKSDRKMAIMDLKEGLFGDPQQILESIGLSDKKSKPLFIDFKFGNSCNLRCRMCTPYSSSSIEKEARQNHENIDYPEHLKLSRKDEKLSNDWYQTNEFNNNLFEHLSKIKILRFTGGEPLKIKAFYEILDHLVEYDYSKNVSIRIITNGTQDPLRLEKYVNRFKKFNISVSVDGTDDIFNYIRYPAQWSKVASNILTLKKMGNFKVKLAITLQASNLFYIDSVLSWAKDHNVNWIMNYLENPIAFNVDILPQSIKDQSLIKIRNVMNLYQEDKEKIMQLSALISRIEKNKLYNEEIWKRFIQVNTSLDKVRNQSFEEVFKSMMNCI